MSRLIKRQMSDTESVGKREWLINRPREKKNEACPAKEINLIYRESFKPREDTQSAHYRTSLPHTHTLTEFLHLLLFLFIL